MGSGMVEFETLSGGMVDGGTSIVRCGGIEGSPDGWVNSICEPFEGGGELWLEAFEGRMVAGGRLVARVGAADDTMVGGEPGTCVLLVNDDEVAFERFNGGNGHCDVGNKNGCETDTGVIFIGIGIVEFDRLSGGTVDGSTSIVRCGGIEGSPDGWVTSICELLRDGGDVWLERFEGLREGGGPFVARGGAAEDTMVAGEMGACVLLEDDGGLGLERFDGDIVHGEDGGNDACETGIGVLFIGMGTVEFERVSGGIVDGTRFVACWLPLAVARVGCNMGIGVLFEADGGLGLDTFNGVTVSGAMGTCVLLEGDREPGLDRFNGDMVHGEGDGNNACEIGIGVPFIGVAMV